MSNSSLVNYTKLVKNYTAMGGKVNRKITIHHMAGNLSVETCANVFNGNRQASSNYGIGSDGRIGLYVEEHNRAWTSSSSWNDSQAVTIEVANDTLAPTWSVSAKAMASLINLCVDICKRNGIPKLVYTGDKNGTLTLHRFYANTCCPGPYIESKISYICNEVNRRLNGGSVQTPSTGGSKNLYRVRKSWGDAKSQLGAFGVLENAKAMVNKNPGYKVVQTPSTGGSKNLYRVRKSWGDAKSQLGAFGVLENAKAMVNKNPGYKVFDHDGNVVYPVSAPAQPGKSLDQVAHDVITGKYGNGEARKNAITKAGYDYNAVQARVNEILGGGKKSVTEIAREVIAGKWGNGSDRKNRLTNAGYDYNAVQREVNRLL